MDLPPPLAARAERRVQERAKALGIKPGPVFGKLKSGETVTLPDGRVIAQSDVCGANWMQ